MKSISPNQMANLSGGGYSCPDICYRALYAYYYSYNPVMYFMALSILNSKTCKGCYEG